MATSKVWVVYTLRWNGDYRDAAVFSEASKARDFLAKMKAKDEDAFVKSFAAYTLAPEKYANKPSRKRVTKQANPGIPKNQWIKATAVKISGGRLLIKK